MTAFVVGCVVGALAGALLGTWRGRGQPLGWAYGLLAAGLVWSGAAIVAGNRADGLAGVGEIVAGGVVFWFVVVPAGVAALVLERRAGRP